MLFTLWSVCVLGPAIVLEFSSLSNAKPTFQSPCSKCKEFDVQDDEHSLCSFGCSSSYTLKTNIPANSDNRNEALIALANKLLPLLREFKKNVHPKRRKLQSFLNEGIGRHPMDSRKVEIIVQHDNLSSGPGSGSVTSSSSSTSLENLDKKLFKSNHHHQSQQDLSPSEEEDPSLRRYGLVRVDPPRRRKVKQEENMNEDLIESSDNFNLNGNPMFPSQRKQYENTNNNNNNNNKHHRLYDEMPRIQHTNTGKIDEWDDHIFTLDERVKSKLKLRGGGAPTNSNYGSIDPTGSRSESGFQFESNSEDFNEIPDETVDQSNKEKILPNPNTKNTKLPNPELEMFSNEDSYILPSKRVKKD